RGPSPGGGARRSGRTSSRRRGSGGRGAPGGRGRGGRGSRAWARAILGGGRPEWQESNWWNSIGGKLQPKPSEGCGGRFELDRTSRCLANRLDGDGKARAPSPTCNLQPLQEWSLRQFRGGSN